MEFVRSFLRRYFAGKPVLVSPLNVRCVLRLSTYVCPSKSFCKIQYLESLWLALVDVFPAKKGLFYDGRNMASSRSGLVNEKRALYLNVNVFRKKVLSKDIIFTRGRHFRNHAKVYPFARQRKYLHFWVILRPWVLVRPWESNPRHQALQSSALLTDLILPRFSVINWIKLISRIYRNQRIHELAFWVLALRQSKSKLELVCFVSSKRKEPRIDLTIERWL